MTDTPNRPDFLGQVKDLLTAAPSKVDAERAEARQRRAKLLELTSPAITEEDVQAIITDQLRPTEALLQVRHWFDMTRGKREPPGGWRPMRFLVLLGAPSRGKTVAACWLLARLGGRYVSAPELARLANSSSWHDREQLVLLRQARLVVVDDLGTESSTSDSFESTLFDLVNHRQGPRYLTIGTGNIEVGEFAGRYGDRVTRRIEHQGMIVGVGGPDLRRKP